MGDLDRVKSAKAKAHNDIQEIQPQLAYLDVIREVLPRDGFFVEELCQAGFTSYYGFPIYEPRTYISSGFQGTLGYGFPTALGAKVAMPDRAVVSIIGDGGFLFAMSEMASAVQHNIGLVTIIFNNSSFGNVRRDQQERFNSNFIGADLVNPNFLKISEAFGVDGHSISHPNELKPILSRALENNRPAIIEVKIERGTEASPWKYIHKTVVAPDS